MKIYLTRANIPDNNNNIKPMPNPPKKIGNEKKDANISKIPDAVLSLIIKPIKANTTGKITNIKGNIINGYPYI